MGLTYRPMLTQLLVPKTTRENGEKFSALTRRPLGPSRSLCQCC